MLRRLLAPWLQEIPDHSAGLYAEIAALSGKLDTQLSLSAKPSVARIKENRQVRPFAEVEFKCYSQFGDDGIIQYLVHMLRIEQKVFIEFGVEDYKEANTRFLITNDNWRGLVIDGSEENVRRIMDDPIYWKHGLTAKAKFIDRGNINDLIASAGFDGKIGLLSVDIDGNDYWVWESIDCVDPVVVICEYNSVFGPDRCISVPYDKDFVRSSAHHSYLYYGASLGALEFLANKKGYALVGSNSAGNNAYFVREDQLGALPRLSVRDAYVSSMFRESRDEAGRFSLLEGEARLKTLAGMPVVNVRTGQQEVL